MESVAEPPKRRGNPNFGSGRPLQTIDYTAAISGIAAGFSNEDVLKASKAKNWRSLTVALANKGYSISTIRKNAIKAVAESNGMATGAVGAAQQKALKSLVYQQVEGKLLALQSSDLPLGNPNQGAVDLLHKLAQTAALVEGWGDERPTTVIGVSIQQHNELDTLEAVEVSSCVTVDESAETQVAQLPDNQQEA